MKTIAIGSDHAAYNEKELLKHYLMALGHEVIDVGCDSEESCDYPVFAGYVATLLNIKKVERGILLCGTGIGMSMAANKAPGCRAAVVYSQATAKAAREHNNANIICMGTREFTLKTISMFTDIWLDTDFEGAEGSRHARRVQMINDLDQR